MKNKTKRITNMSISLHTVTSAIYFDGYSFPSTLIYCQCVTNLLPDPMAMTVTHKDLL